MDVSMGKFRGGIGTALPEALGLQRIPTGHLAAVKLAITRISIFRVHDRLTFAESASPLTASARTAVIDPVDGG